MSRVLQDWVGHTLGGRYRIEEKLAEGGMATVYKAYDPNLRRTVAVKLIHPHLSTDPEFVRRFKQEAASVAQLRHPNIVQVYDFDHDAGVHYIVLEYVPGQTLKDLLKALNASNQRLPLTTTLPIMVTICDAVTYAHHKAMIHRDLKPANVMLNQRGEPILMDFGVAKMLGETQHTMTGAVIGTALYMSPEQAQGTAIDSRTDIYSLGVMLFEMITGRPPFEGNSAVAIMMKHVNEPVPDICEIDENIPDELVVVVQKALAKDPAQRFQTAAQMGVALRSVDAALRAGPVTVLSPAPKPVVPAAAPPAPSKKRGWIPLAAALTLGAILILALGAGVLYTAWQYIGPRVLARAQDLPSASGMVYLNEGRYLIGLDSPDKEHVTPRQVELKQFWIDQYEVTNAEYAKFVLATGGCADKLAGRPTARRQRELPCRRGDLGRGSRLL